MLHAFLFDIREPASLRIFIKTILWIPKSIPDGVLRYANVLNLRCKPLVMRLQCYRPTHCGVFGVFSKKGNSSQFNGLMIIGSRLSLSNKRINSQNIDSLSYGLS